MSKTAIVSIPGRSVRHIVDSRRASHTTRLRAQVGRIGQHGGSLYHTHNSYPYPVESHLVSTVVQHGTKLSIGANFDRSTPPDGTVAPPQRPVRVLTGLPCVQLPRTRRYDSAERGPQVPDTVGYTDVKTFDTPGCRTPSRDYSRQYEHRDLAFRGPDINNGVIRLKPFHHK